MLNKESIEQFIKKYQTDIENVAREYCQHLFLSFLYQQEKSERLLFKGGTALRIVFQSPRFSEDLDFTGSGIRQNEIEELFMNTLAEVERSGVVVDLVEGKKTTGGYIGIATFFVYNQHIKVQIEVSLRNSTVIKGTRTLISSDYLPPYTLVYLPVEGIVRGKLEALISRHKPRDFYDYFFLLCGNYPLVKEKKTLKIVLKLLVASRINFKSELKKFLPASHAMHLKDFRDVLEQKIVSFLGKE